MALLLDVEQHPDQSNHISLGSDASALSRPPLAIRWSPRAADVAAIIKIARHVFDAWHTDPSSDAVLIKPRPLEEIADDLQRAGNAFDVYHPSGTTRMGSSAESGVLDRECRVFGFSNLYVASTSAFPRTGAANPTYSLLALASRLADQLGNR
jgi:choline dehydrogenase-like flavoprotein